MKLEIDKAIENIFSQMEDETLDASYGEWHLCGTEKAKQSILSLLRQVEVAAIESATPVKIMGKTIDEVCVILSALELERITDMEMTMSKLNDWMKVLREDYKESIQKAINKTITDRLSTFKEKSNE